MTDIDSLLNDLDGIIDEPHMTAQSDGRTQYFKPRPPSREKIQAFCTNPKVKFAHTPPKRLSSSGVSSFVGDGNSSVNLQSNGNRGNENRYANGYNTSKGKDEIDDILELFDSPSNDDQMNNNRAFSSTKKTPTRSASSPSSSSQMSSSQSTSIWTPDKSKNENKIPSIVHNTSTGYPDCSDYSSSSNNRNMSSKLPSSIGSPETYKFGKDQTSEHSTVFTSGNSNICSYVDSISIPRIVGASSGSGHNDSYSYSSSSGKVTNGMDSGYNSAGGSYTTSFPPTSAATSSSSSLAGAGGVKTRCSKVMLGGSAYTRGLKSSAFSKCLCDNLRCLQCNFKVKVFIGFAWDDSVDYMFLRNNMPNDSKLSPKLNSAPECAAYCCQCTSAHLSEERTLSQGAASDPQWVCSGH